MCVETRYSGEGIKKKPLWNKLLNANEAGVFKLDITFLSVYMEHEYNNFLQKNITCNFQND